jgi:hypothetical protein
MSTTQFMKTRARYSRIFCVLLLLNSLLILSLLETPANSRGEGGGGEGKPDKTTTATSSTSETTISSTSETTISSTSETTISSTSETTISSTSETTASSETAQTTVIVTTVVLTTGTVVCPLVPGFVSIPCEMNPAMVLGFVMLVIALLASALVLKSRSSRALEELDKLRTRPSAITTESELSASSALKRLLELGVLQPREYMEKKILAERIEKKTSAKQLLDKGFISKQQYDALTQKQEE